MTSLAQAGRERIAVCVCTADRPALLARLLATLEGVDWPSAEEHDLLLIVVDNRPGHGAAAVVEAARPRLPLPLILAEEPVPGISFARNRAVATALEQGAEWVAFIDDDDLPQPDWLRHLLETRRLTGADMVFGSQRPSPAMPIPGWGKRLTLFDPKPRAQLNMFGIPAGASTCNVLLSRGLLAALAEEGPVFRLEFARTGGGDTDLFVRAARRGFSFAVSAESQVWLMWEPERLTWSGVTRRSFRYGVNRWRLRVALGQHDGRAAELRRNASLLWRKTRRMWRARSGKRRFAREYFRFVEQLGEAYALLGGSFSYYDRGVLRRLLPRPRPAAPCEATNPQRE